MSTAINPKGPRLETPGTGATTWAQTYLLSTVGQKILIAITGASLVLFVAFHLIGNLKIFNGREAINHYAHFLKHDLGLLIWIARAGLLGAFGLHLVLAINLKRRSLAARPVGYFNQRSAQATPQSKTMIWTGLVILAFVLFHLAHYTFAMVHQAPNGQNYLDLKDANGQHDVYAMMIAGFSSPVISGLYLVAQAFLFIHLAHGIQSVFQTLGLVGKSFTPAVRLLGFGISGLIFAGNTAIVVAVLVGYLK
jgi:succinate dehydrogenase / fumarate reductase cytochrome b subunit